MTNAWRAGPDITAGRDIDDDDQAAKQRWYVQNAEEETF
jgi:hypothetical protein